MISGSENLRVVLASPRNPLNIGAAARAMSNFGVFDLRLINPYEVAFREVRSAIKSERVVREAREFPTIAEAVADCAVVVGATDGSLRDLHAPLYRLDYVGPRIRQALQESTVGFLFGSEKFGLSREELSHCHWLVNIPTRPDHSSMNLGQAVAVCLYELVRDDAAAKVRLRGARRAAAEDQERVSSLLTDLLEESGWLNESTAGSSTLKVRELVRRMQLSEKDAQVWFGILRQIQWRMKNLSGR